MPQCFHTGTVKKGGGAGVHNYPTPVIDMDRFRYDDFTLWVKDAQGQPTAVVPTNKRGEPGREVKIVHVTPGTELADLHLQAQRVRKHLVADESSALAKQAFARVPGDPPTT